MVMIWFQPLQEKKVKVAEERWVELVVGLRWK